MKRTLLILLIGSLSITAHAQMDMLPQIFRDMPPEFQEGIPEQMSFAEYRQLNRNVDFFTMFMSMIVPGYGLFQVEKPAGAWSIVAARGVGYGMMTAAVVRQWSNFRDIWRRMEIPDTDYQHYLTNAFLFGGGVMINGFGWAFDVLLAYHIAKNEKDLVQYKYGLEMSLAGAAEAGEGPQRREQYLRRLLAQRTDPAIQEELRSALPAFAAAYPEHRFAAEANYHAALLEHANGNDAAALVRLLRVAYRYPDSDLTDDAVRLAVQITELNRRAWRDASGELYRLIEAAQVVVPGTSTSWRSLRAVEHVSALLDLPAEPFADAAIAEAQAFVRDYPTNEAVPRVLYQIGLHLVDQDEVVEAVSYLATVVVAYQSAEVWAEAALDLGRLYIEVVNDPDRARIVLLALVEDAPERDQARVAQELLEDAGLVPEEARSAATEQE